MTQHSRQDKGRILNTNMLYVTNNNMLVYLDVSSHECSEYTMSICLLRRPNEFVYHTYILFTPVVWSTGQLLKGTTRDNTGT